MVREAISRDLARVGDTEGGRESGEGQMIQVPLHDEDDPSDM